MMKQFLDNSYLFGGNAPFVEDLYEKYLADPASVPEEWRGYFDKLQLLPGASSAKDVAHAPVVESFAQRAKSGPAKAAASEAILASSGSITHHHGVGTDHREFYEREIGAQGLAALRAVKATLDPAGILNPGVLFEPR